MGARDERESRDGRDGKEVEVRSSRFPELGISSRACRAFPASLARLACVRHRRLQQQRS